MLWLESLIMNYISQRKISFTRSKRRCYRLTDQEEIGNKYLYLFIY